MRGTAPAAPARRSSSLLARQDCCLSAQEIHDKLRGAVAGRSGLASVYRALDVLAQLKLVHRIDVDGTACYEPADPSGDHHHHAICDRCGKMDAFEDPELERLIDGARRAARLRGRRPRDRAARRLPGLQRALSGWRRTRPPSPS